MNRLSLDARAEIASAFVEGNSIRGICRLTGRSKDAVSKLLLDMGRACVRYHDATVRNVKARRIECDEIWSFVGCKQRTVPKAKRPESIGDVWTWIGIDAESKLAIAWLVGDRDADSANDFMRDVASRLANRVQLTTDGHSVYLQAVENAFGWNGTDYAQLVKLYGSAPEEGTRYSPPVVLATRKTWIMGKPDIQFVSTSYVERQNLTLRMRCRRFTRLTNAFSKTLEHHAAAVALHFMHYNFVRIHQSLRVTPAMEAGITHHKWTMRELVSLLDPPRQAVA